MKRRLLATLLDRFGLAERMLRLRRDARAPLLTALTYHRIGSPEAAGELDPEVFDADLPGFVSQLDLVARHFNAVSIEDVVHHRYGKPLPPNPMLLSFDDGYAETYDVVLPLLLRRGLRATFFIATAFPGAGRLYWWDRVALLLKRAVRDPVHLVWPLRMTLHPRRGLAGARRALLGAIKRTPGLDLDLLFADLSRGAGVVLSVEEERALAERTILGWDAVRALAHAGMDVQSHTHQHRVLATMSEADALTDLRTSREMLTRQVGVTPRAVAYPVGHALTRHQCETVARAGFDIGFTNCTGVAETWRLDPYQIPRIAMDPTIGNAELRGMLAVPWLSQSPSRTPRVQDPHRT